MDEIEEKSIALVEHPVSPELKKKIRKKGLKIIDLKYKDRVAEKYVAEIIEKPKDKDGDGLKDKDGEIEALRDEAKELGIEFDGRWGADKLKEAIEAKKAE